MCLLFLCIPAILLVACADDEGVDDWEDDDDDDDEGDDDWDWEDDDDQDDDDGGDDDVGDDDNWDCDWVDELTWFSDFCATIQDQNGNDMTTDEVVADCNDCIGACSGGYMDDCDGAFDCVIQNCF